MANEMWVVKPPNKWRIFMAEGPVSAAGGATWGFGPANF
jgi:hypothetical protein